MTDEEKILAKMWTIVEIIDDPSPTGETPNVARKAQNWYEKYTDKNYGPALRKYGSKHKPERDRFEPGKANDAGAS